MDLDRDRDREGRARNARPRDVLGRPLPYGAPGEERAPEGVLRTPGEALTEAQRLLDAGRPFHAHEVLEDAWKQAPDDERQLWRGLAQLAVGCTHRLRGNARGAATLLDRGAVNIAPYAAAPPHGIDVAGLLRWARAGGAEVPRLTEQQRRAFRAVALHTRRMRSFEAVTRIQADRDEVWRRLVDVGSWRDWDSGVDRVEGRVALGERLTLYATMIRSRPFSVTVTEIRPGEAMRWRGGLPFGLAVIDRTYSLAGQEDGSTVLTVRENHSGPLAGLLGRTTPDLNPSFRQFCEGLKALAEGRSSRHTG